MLSSTSSGHVSVLAKCFNISFVRYVLLYTYVVHMCSVLIGITGHAFTLYLIIITFYICKQDTKQNSLAVNKVRGQSEAAL